VRFSADKSPYKTSIAATLETGGYINLSSERLGVGCGMYVMATDQLDRYRRAVVNDATGAELESIVADAGALGIEVSGHDMLKRAPKGYPSDHPRIDLLRSKGLIAWRDWPVGAWLGTKKAKTRIVDFLQASRPLNDWLTTNVGASTLEDARR
jgi:uncharacterized protein (TIGR02453 family)